MIEWEESVTMLLADSSKSIELKTVINFNFLIFIENNNNEAKKSSVKVSADVTSKSIVLRVIKVDENGRYYVAEAPVLSNEKSSCFQISFFNW